MTFQGPQEQLSGRHPACIPCRVSHYKVGTLLTSVHWCIPGTETYAGRTLGAQQVSDDLTEWPILGLTGYQYWTWILSPCLRLLKPTKSVLYQCCNTNGVIHPQPGFPDREVALPVPKGH